MIKRISGLVMIVNTLMPIFVLIGLVVVGNLIWEFLAGKLQGPVQNVTNALEVLREEASNARRTIIAVTAEVSENVSAAKTKLDIATAGVATATDQIDATVTPIANFEVPIAESPKLQERKPTWRNPIPYEVKMRVKRVKPFEELGKPFVSLAAATTQALDASADIKKTIEAVKKLSPLADIFGEYKNKFDALAQQIKTIVDIFSKMGDSIAFLLKKTGYHPLTLADADLWLLGLPKVICRMVPASRKWLSGRDLLVASGTGWETARTPIKLHYPFIHSQELKIFAAPNALTQI